MFDLFEAYNAGDLLWLGDWSPTWLVLLAAVGVSVIALSAYDLRSLRPLRRWTLVGLRAAVYGLAVLLLLEPAVDLKQVETVKNDLAVLVDTSRTMSLRADGETTRYDRVRSALESLGGAVDRLERHHDVHLFGFDGSVRPRGRQSLADAEPDGGASDLTGALKHLDEEFGTGDLGGIVLLTDGIDTGAIGQRVPRGKKLDERTRELLDDLDAPVNALSAASSDGIRDVAISEVDHDEFAFVHNKTTVDVELQVVGLGQTSFNLKLHRQGDLVQTRSVEVRPDKSRYEVSFEFVPKSIGKEVYTVSAPEFSDEALHDNNVVHFLQNIIRDKIRVLQVVGQPSWDERFLRRLLKENPNVDLISFFILRTTSSVRLVPQDELSLIPFPTQELFEEQLGSFDLVLFQNFNFGPYNMDRYLGSIAEYVRDGGAFAMIGGPLSFASGGYSGTPIADILPVRLPNSEMPEAILDTRPFRPRLSSAGKRHPITQMAFDPQSNLEIWESLPKLRGTNVVEGAKSSATVLARHPQLRKRGRRMPVLTVGSAGDGRVLAFTSDSSWRWGFEHVGRGGTPREYQTFWNSAIRWLIRDPELKLIQVDIPNDRYPPGDTIEANIRISRPDYTPAAEVQGDVGLRYRSFDSLEETGRVRGGRRLRESTFTTDADGRETTELKADRPGIYTVRASASTDAGDLKDSEIALVVPDVEEFRQIVPRDDLLEKFAEATDGMTATLPDFSPSDLVLDRSSEVEVERRRVIHLWDSFAVFVVIVGLLGAEWFLRRRWGRL